MVSPTVGVWFVEMNWMPKWSGLNSCVIERAKQCSAIHSVFLGIYEHREHPTSAKSPGSFAWAVNTRHIFESLKIRIRSAPFSRDKVVQQLPLSAAHRRLDIS